MGRVVVVGSINTDLVVRVPRFPQPGETLMANTFAVYGGGKGANQAIAAARCGAETIVIGAVGDDPFRDERLRGLEQEGIDITHILRRHGIPGGIAVIHVADSGENTISVFPGANGTLSPADIRDVWTRDARDADIWCAQLEIPPAAVLEAFRLARQQGSTTVLNAAPPAGMIDDLWPFIDVLVVNRAEAAQLSGLADAAPVTLGAALRSRGPQVVIVTLGQEGACFCLEHQQFFVEAPHVPAIDTTAAGDAFIGALIALRAEGWSWEELAPWAVWAGAIAVQRAGAQPSLPTRAEIAEAVARQPLHSSFVDKNT